MALLRVDLEGGPPLTPEEQRCMYDEPRNEDETRYLKELAPMVEAFRKRGPRGKVIDYLADITFWGVVAPVGSGKGFGQDGVEKEAKQQGLPIVRLQSKATRLRRRKEASRAEPDPYPNRLDVNDPKVQRWLEKELSGKTRGSVKRNNIAQIAQHESGELYLLTAGQLKRGRIHFGELMAAEMRYQLEMGFIKGVRSLSLVASPWQRWLKSTWERSGSWPQPFGLRLQEAHDGNNFALEFANPEQQNWSHGSAKVEHAAVESLYDGTLPRLMLDAMRGSERHTRERQEAALAQVKPLDRSISLLETLDYNHLGYPSILKLMEPGLAAELAR